MPLLTRAGCRRETDYIDHHAYFAACHLGKRQRFKIAAVSAGDGCHNKLRVTTDCFTCMDTVVQIHVTPERMPTTSRSLKCRCH
jgi:hypothetical protein